MIILLKAIIFYVLYIGIVILVSFGLNKLAFFIDDCRLRKKGIGLINESDVYKNLLEEFEKNKSHKYCEETIQNYKKHLNVDKEELLHTYRIIQSDLETITIDTIIYTIITTAMSLFFSLISKFLVSIMQNRIENLDSNIISELLMLYLCVLLISRLIKNMEAYRNKKYFVYLIEEVIEECKSNKEMIIEENESNIEVEIQNMKSHMDTLEKECKRLKKKVKQLKAGQKSK